MNRPRPTPPPPSNTSGGPCAIDYAMLGIVTLLASAAFIGLFLLIGLAVTGNLDGDLPREMSIVGLTLHTILGCFVFVAGCAIVIPVLIYIGKVAEKLYSRL